MTGAGDAAADHDQDVLQARARELARLPVNADVAAGPDLLRFRLAGACYAVPIGQVSSVLPLGELTPVPCTPSFVAGVINVRGRITAVIDLLDFLQVAATGLNDLHHVVLLRHADVEFGLLVNAVLDVGSPAAASADALTHMLCERPSSHCSAVTADGVVVLDVESIVRDPRFNINEEI